MAYNKGDNYEQNIFDLLTAKGLIAIGSNRGGAGNATDIKFLQNLVMRVILVTGTDTKDL